MKILTVEGENFKNLYPFKISPAVNNIISGDNAQGKTNFIEAIWIFSGLRGFRGTKDIDYIKIEDLDQTQNNRSAQLKMKWHDGKREMKARIDIISADKKIVKKAYLNNVPLKNISGLVGKFKCCVFSPAHLNIVEGGPLIRRRFLDTAISQLRPDYAIKVAEYERIINQRNALLRNSRNSKVNSVLPDTLEIWDEQLAKLGTMVHLLRQDYLKKLCKPAKEIYSEIAGEKESFGIKYISTIFKEYKTGDSYNNTNISYYYDKLRENQKSDIAAGYTTSGIHRDDLEFTINGLSSKIYGSQGQKRSSVLALKLGEAAVIKEVCGISPIMLLDDVLSELDESRREYILHNIKDMQVFLTSCDTKNREDTVNLKDERYFIIKNGKFM